MPQGLAIQARPMPRETLVSLVSRTAAMHGIPMSVFAREVGLSLLGLLNTTPEALGRLSELFDIEDYIIEEMVSWSGKQINGEVRMTYRGETIISRALRNPTVRGCALCLQEDINASNQDADQCAYLRGDWLFRHSFVCTKHSVPLMTLWAVDKSVERYDISRLIKTVDLSALIQEADKFGTPVTSYDYWLERRLTTRDDDSWLASIPVGHAAKFCCLLGEELARLPENNGQGASGNLTSRALGFDVASAGKEAISEAYLSLTSLASGHSDKPQKAFGRLYAWLSHETRDDPSCDEFRDTMREIILQVWPIAAGETLLGKTLQRRALHSVASAAAELDIGPELLRRLLISEGYFSANDDRPNTRLTIEAPTITRLHNKIAGLVGIGEMRRSMNVTVTQFKALIDGELIKPARLAVSQKQPWDPNDGERFLNALLEGARSPESCDDGWEHIHKSSLRVRVSLQAIVEAIRQGDVVVGKAVDRTGFASILVDKASVDRTLRPSRPDMPSVAEFARTVGLHRNGRLNRLVAADEVAVTRIFNPLTAQHSNYMSDADVDKFHQKFTTLKLLSQLVGRESRAVSIELAREGIERFSPDGAQYGAIFRMEDLNDWINDKLS